MKNATKYTKATAALLKKLPEGTAAEFPDTDEPVAVLVQSLLLENTTTSRAQTAYKRLCEEMVDYNDLRVTMASEMVERIGTRYPQALARCQRIRSALRQVYLREHAMTLERLSGAGKREVKKFFEKLEDVTPYATARTMLLAFDTHAIPVDDQLRDGLAEAGAIDPDATVADTASWLSRVIKASDGVASHYALQAWIESAGAGGSSSRKRSSKATDDADPATSKKTTRGAARSKAES